MESQPQNPEFRNNLKTFTHAVYLNLQIRLLCFLSALSLGTAASVLFPACWEVQGTWLNPLIKLCVYRTLVSYQCQLPVLLRTVTQQLPDLLH